MATGSTNLEVLYGAIEVSEGTATTPTRKLYVGPGGGIDISGIQKYATIEDRRAWGKRTSLAAVYSGTEDSVLRITGAPVAYESIGWWLTALAPSGGVVPGTVDSSAYSRTFTPVETTTVNTYGTGFYTLNLEFSATDFASTKVWKMPAMRIINFTINFSKRASGGDTGLTFDAELQMTKGTATAATAFSTALADYTQTLAIGNQLAAYVDTTTIGSTADTNVSAARFSLTNPVSFHDGMDGTQGHTSAHHSLQWTPMLTLTRKFSDLTELNAYVAKTTRKVRIFSTGGIVGATTATNQFYLDFYGKPMDHRVVAADGMWYAEIDLEGIYDTTATTSWVAFLRNNVAAAYTAT